MDNAEAASALAIIISAGARGVVCGAPRVWCFWAANMLRLHRGTGGTLVEHTVGDGRAYGDRTSASWLVLDVLGGIGTWRERLDCFAIDLHY